GFVIRGHQQRCLVHRLRSAARVRVIRGGAAVGGGDRVRATGGCQRGNWDAGATARVQGHRGCQNGTPFLKRDRSCLHEAAAAGHGGRDGNGLAIERRIG